MWVMLRQTISIKQSAPLSKRACLILLLDGKLSETPTTLRYLGKVLGVENLTEPQARYAEETLKQTVETPLNLPKPSI